MPSSPKFIIVIGTSAGGINASTELISQLNNKMDAAFFLVLHLSGKAISDLLLHRLKGYTTLDCKIAKHGEKIAKGTIYLAPSDLHLLINEEEIILGQGPTENRWRPSIDVLFRSAAAAFGPRSIGIILTGLLNDGAAGMSAIKRSGGICIVQDPNEAEFPDMPLSVLNIMPTDYCIPLFQMGNVITELTDRTPPKDYTIPADVLAEAQIAERTSTSLNNLVKLGEHSLYACPDCGGGLWHMQDNKLERYRCHVGHVYTEKELFTRQGESLETTLWVALRMMEERSSLLEKMATDERKKGLNTIASYKEERNVELQGHIHKLKDILFTEHQEEVKTHFGEPAVPGVPG
jgi:two-component system chemotaxis response regulator CheB